MRQNQAEIGFVHSDIDRGWAWMVLIAVYLGIIASCIPLYMGGVIYIELMDRYHESEAKTSLVGALSSGLLCFSAPIGGIVNNKFSCRLSIVIGGVFATIGFALSALATSLDWIIITAGVIVGFGYGLYSCGLICAVGFYFEKKRDVVLSSSYIAIGVGMFLSTPLGLYLTYNHGLPATFFVLASMQAQLCVIGVICKPSVIESEILTQKNTTRTSKISSKSKTYFDLSLLRNIPYFCFLCSTCTWNFALSGAIMHLSNYVSVLDGSHSDISYIMSSFSVANIIGRLAGSIVISKLHQKVIYIHVFALAVSGLLTSLFPLYSESCGGIYIYSIQLGFFTGLPNALFTPLSVIFVGIDKLSDAYGLNYIFCGIGVSSGPIVIGYVYGVFNSYEYSFLVAGSVLIIGSLLGVSTVCSMRHTPIRNKMGDAKRTSYSDRNIVHNANISLLDMDTSLITTEIA